jgi:hypothetical protein
MRKVKAARLFRLLFLLVGVVIVSLFITNSIRGILPLPAASPNAFADGGPMTVACTASSPQRPSFGGTITVEPGSILCGDVTMVGGTLSIQGQLHGNILAFGANILLNGGVNGDIRLFGGSIHFGNASSVLGNVNLYGSRVDGEKEVRIGGTFNDHSKDTGLFGLGAFNFPVWFLLLMIPLGLLYARFFPEHLLFVSAAVKNKARRSLLIGLLSALLAPAILLVLIALILFIPVALIVLIVLGIAWTVGTIAICWMLGEQVIRAFRTRPSTRYLQVIVGVIMLAIFMSLPFIGWIVFLGTGIVGIGAVFLSRFGTRLYRRPEEPLSISMRM